MVLQYGINRNKKENSFITEIASMTKSGVFIKIDFETIAITYSFHNLLKQTYTYVKILSRWNDVTCNLTNKPKSFWGDPCYKCFIFMWSH